MENSQKKETNRKVFRNFSIFGLIIIATFIIAGKIDWWNGWLFYGLYFLMMAFIGMNIAKKNPSLIKERVDDHKNIKPWDRIILKLYYLFCTSGLIVGALDSGRFGWSGKMSYYLIIPAVIVVTGSYALIAWAMSTNNFFSSQVRIQEDRNHRVCNEGPYRYIRHPGYTGTMIMWLVLPIILGSWWVYVPSFLLITLFIIRTSLEDKTLQEELTGYKEYTKITKYRLLPFVW